MKSVKFVSYLIIIFACRIYLCQRQVLEQMPPFRFPAVRYAITAIITVGKACGYRTSRVKHPIQSHPCGFLIDSDSRPEIVQGYRNLNVSAFYGVERDGKIKCSCIIPHRNVTQLLKRPCFRCFGTIIPVVAVSGNQTRGDYN